MDRIKRNLVKLIGLSPLLYFMKGCGPDQEQTSVASAGPLLKAQSPLWNIDKNITLVGDAYWKTLNPLQQGELQVRIQELLSRGVGPAGETLNEKIANDYKNRRVVRYQYWYFSQTETELCGYFSQQA